MENHSNHLKIMLGAVVVFILLAALGVPVLANLPLLALIAICPLMMFFMMRGMNHGGSDSKSTDDEPVDESADTSGHRH